MARAVRAAAAPTPQLVPQPPASGRERERERESLARPKLLVTVEEAAWMLSVGKTTLYELFAAGVIRSVQIKRSRLVPVAELEAYVRALLAA